MKSKLLLVLSFTLIFALILTACQGTTEESVSTSISEAVSDLISETENDPENKEEAKLEEKEEVKDETSELPPESETDVEDVTEEEINKEVDYKNTVFKCSEDYDPNKLYVKTSDEIMFKGIGETFEGWIKISDGEYENVRGTEGVYYTLNSVQIYDSINDAELDPNGTIAMESKEVLDNNTFILCDFTAYYEKPENGNDTVRGSADQFIPEFLLEKSEDKTLYEQETELENFVPYVVYCSDMPKGDDQELLNSNQGFRYVINDGESFNFQVGLVAGEKFTNDNNVYLMINYVPGGYLEDYTYKFFTLYPEN